MITYRYALGNDNNVIDVIDLPKGLEDREKYICIGCGNELIASLGAKRVNHFKHKHLCECSSETYLHKLAKKLFTKEYNDCLNNDIPFNITLPVIHLCDTYKFLGKSRCEIKTSSKSFDLTQYYHTVKTEIKEGEFIPDVSLVSQSQPIIFIEFAVTHFSEKKKKISGNLIIEIRVESENQIQNLIKERDFNPENSAFYGFSPSSTVTDSECQCHDKKCYCLIIYKSGKSFLEYGTLRYLSSKIYKNKESIQHLVFHTTKDNLEFDFTADRAEIFTELLNEAVNKNFKIKNCLACKYGTVSRNYYENGYAFCKFLKENKLTNDAANCQYYKQSSPI